MDGNSLPHGLCFKLCELLRVLLDERRELTDGCALLMSWEFAPGRPSSLSVLDGNIDI